MTEIERKALALVNEVRKEQGYINYGELRRDYSVMVEALCRAIERIEELEANERDCCDYDYAKPLTELQAEYEAFRRAVSDALEYVRDNTSYDVHPKLWRFIIAKPDPLVEAWMDAFPGNHIDDAREECAKINAALAARGLEIREKQP